MDFSSSFLNAFPNGLGQGFCLSFLMFVKNSNIQESSHKFPHLIHLEMHLRGKSIISLYYHPFKTKECNRGSADNWTVMSIDK